MTGTLNRGHFVRYRPTTLYSGHSHRSGGVHGTEYRAVGYTVRYTGGVHITRYRVVGYTPRETEWWRTRYGIQSGGVHSTGYRVVGYTARGTEWWGTHHGVQSGGVHSTGYLVVGYTARDTEWWATQHGIQSGGVHSTGYRVVGLPLRTGGRLAAARRRATLGRARSTAAGNGSPQPRASPARPDCRPFPRGTLSGTCPPAPETGAAGPVRPSNDGHGDGGGLFIALLLTLDLLT